MGIADVIGKGIPAAIMMSLFRGAMRAYADIGDSKDTVGETIDKLNKMACRQCRDGEFVSLFYAVIDVKNMAVTYCDCGHEPTVLIREGQIKELEKGGLVLGVEPQSEYEIETLGLRDGDCLLFYTDGLIDAVNFDGQFWGRQRMLETAKRFTAGSAEQMIKNIIGYRRRFVGLARQNDDTSVVVIKVDRAAEPEFRSEVSF